jgi:hypothetical protein
VGFVLDLGVLPALAGGDADDGVILLVLRGFDFCSCCSSGQCIPGECQFFNNETITDSLRMTYERAGNWDRHL